MGRRRIREFKGECRGIEKAYVNGVNYLRHGMSTLLEASLMALFKKRFNSSLLIKDVGDNKMILDLNDAGISRELAIQGVHEKNSTEFIQNEIHEGMTILEIGANIGYYLLIGAKLVGSSGKIYAFEPSPENRRLLGINILLNGIEDRVEVFPYGVGSKEETKPFYLMNKGNTSSFIDRVNDRDMTCHDVINVQIVSADTFCTQRGVSFDYFRMDVEGFEYEIVSGMEESMAREGGPKGGFIEIHSALLRRFDRSAGELVGLLRSYGFEVVRAFFRGLSEISVSSTEAFLSHELREYGYWETFFRREAMKQREAAKGP